MSVRKRGKRWHFVFEYHGRLFSGPTPYPAIDGNRERAEIFCETQRALVQQGLGPVPLESVPFTVAAEKFLEWCDANKRSSTAARIHGSFASLTKFFDDRRDSDYCRRR